MKADNRTTRFSSGTRHLAAVIVTTLLAVVVSVYFLRSGRFIIFQNLFYFPIIIACIYYLKRGFIFSVGLTFLYFFLFTAHTADFNLIREALIRVVIFIFIAGVVTLASLRRRRAEQALRASEEKYRNLIEKSSDWVWAVDQEGRYTYSSPKVWDILGYKPEELIGKTPFELMPPEEVSKVASTFSDYIAARKPFSGLVNVNLHRDGRRISLETSAEPIFDVAGAFTGYRGIDRDITERKEKMAEIELKSQLLDSAIDSIFVMDLEGNFQYVNESAYKSRGYSRDELMAMNLKALDDPSYREAISSRFTEIVEKGTAIFESAHLRKDGSVIPIEVHSRLVEAKGQKLLFSIIRDISERKRMEELLKSNEKKYRDIFENATDGIFQSTPEGRHITVNPALARIVGFSSPGEMIDAITDTQRQLYVHPEDRIKIIKLFSKQDAVNNYETEFRRKDGVLIWVSINARAVRDESGNIILFEGTITDITERKKILAELQKKNLELARAYEELRNKQATIIEQEKMASIGMLAAGIAHEIKNPLSIILQGIDYLKSTATDNSLMVEVVERLSKAIFRADEIVKSLISYSRRKPLSLTAQSIPELIDESLALIDHEFHRKNLQVIRQYAPDLPQVAVDGNQIKQVFINVLLNGIDAMPPKGIFTISVRQIEDDAGKNALQISFKDTGEGIPAGKIKNIFDPFYTTKNIGNTGLGLSVSRGIIDSHGGRIYAESENEQGADIIIELPLP